MPPPPGPLSLDPASLQAIHDLVDATKKQTQAATDAAHKSQGIAGQVGAGLGNLAHWGAAQQATAQQGFGAVTGQLQSLHQLQLGQAMGMKLAPNPVTGQLEWMNNIITPKGPAGGAPKAGGGFLESMGMPKGLAGPLVAFAGVRHMTEMSKGIASTMHDELLTQGQKERGYFKAIMPGGESLLDFHDTVTGRKRDMQRVGEESARMGIQTQSVIERNQAGYHLTAQADQYRIRATTLGAASPVLMPTIDRSTATGERRFELESRMLPYRERAAKADRDSIEANGRVNAALRQQQGLREEGLYLARREADINRQLNQSTPGARPESKARGIFNEIVGGATFGVLDPSGARGAPEGPERAMLLEQRQQVYQQQAANSALKIENTKDVFARQEEAARAKGEKVKANAGLLRGQGDIAEYNASTAAGSAARLTGLGVGGRMESQMIFDMVKNDPSLLALDPMFAEKASKIDPKEVQKLMEGVGEKLPEYQAGAKAGLPSFPVKPGETIEGERQRGAGLHNEARKEDYRGEAESAKEAHDGAEKVKPEIIRMLAEALAIALKGSHGKDLLGRVHQ